MSRMLRVVALCATVVATVSLAFAAKEKNAAGKEAVEKELLQKYKLSAWQSGRGFTTVGTIIIVKKQGLEAIAQNIAVAPVFNYKDGRLSKNLISRALSNVVPFPPNSTFVITRIEARENHVAFDLLSADPIDDVFYKAAVHVDFPKGYLEQPDMKQIGTVIAQVFDIEQPQQGQPGQQQQPGPGQPPPQQQQQQQRPMGQAPGNMQSEPPPPPPPPVTPAKPAIEEPPPPPPPPPAAVELKTGMTVAQVEAALGKPQKILKLGPKEVYIYDNMKITFTNGKVSAMD